MLLLVALTLVAGAIGELGHATASRYAGAEPSVIGLMATLVRAIRRGSNPVATRRIAKAALTFKAPR